MFGAPTAIVLNVDLSVVFVKLKIAVLGFVVVPLRTATILVLIASWSISVGTMDHLTVAQSCMLL